MCAQRIYSLVGSVVCSSSEWLLGAKGDCGQQLKHYITRNKYKKEQMK